MCSRALNCDYMYDIREVRELLLIHNHILMVLGMEHILVGDY